jgi:TRAP-type uncharacterized transport system substrate-binding protein
MTAFEAPRPVIIRSKLVLEVSSELVGNRAFPQAQAQVQLRPQGGQDWHYTIFGSDSPSGIHAVASGEAQIAIVNPGGPLTMAYLGKGAFKESVPVRAITIIPSRDWMGFAVKESTGITSLADVKAEKYPLKVSVRAQRDHSMHLYVDQVLAAYGYSLADVISWGGSVSYDTGLPVDPARIGKVQSGEVEAIFDESMTRFVAPAIESGLRILPLEEPIIQQMEAVGFRRATLTKAQFPSLPADVPTLDFSGWPVFTRADVPDDFVYTFCRALEARKDRIPTQLAPSLPLDSMCKDSPEGPLDVPLHPAAERFWKEVGYL